MSAAPSASNAIVRTRRKSVVSAAATLDRASASASSCFRRRARMTASAASTQMKLTTSPPGLSARVEAIHSSASSWRRLKLETGGERHHDRRQEAALAELSEACDHLAEDALFGIEVIACLLDVREALGGGPVRDVRFGKRL